MVGVLQFPRVAGQFILGRAFIARELRFEFDACGALGGLFDDRFQSVARNNHVHVEIPEEHKQSLR